MPEAPYLELAQLVFHALELELQLLDLSIQRADLVFEAIDAQKSRRAAAAALTAIVVISGRTLIILRELQIAGPGRRRGQTGESRKRQKQASPRPAGFCRALRLFFVIFVAVQFRRQNRHASP